MKYYLCKPVDAPPRLENTQADAKAVDPKFVEHHVPDGKDERRDYVNDLLAKAHGAMPDVQQPVASPAPKPAKAADPVDRDIGIVDILNRTSIEEALWASDERGLVVLEQCIFERRKELYGGDDKAAPTVAGRDTVNPPKRRRKSA